MLSKIIDQSLIDESKKIISRAKSIVIVTHVGPDGDAMGASLAMWHFLKSLGKENVFVITPNQCPDFLMWLPKADQVVVYEHDVQYANDKIADADLIIGLDFNDLSRISAVGDALGKTSAQKILLDHHPYPGNFANVLISHPEISSTCEIVFRFICRLGYFQSIDLPTAECIYTGMMTDTGNFSYNSNNPEVYFIISELLKVGIDKDEIYDRINSNQSAERMKLLGYCLYKKMKLFPEQGTALIAVTQAELEKFNYKSGDLEGLVNMPLGIAGVMFSVFMREDTDKIKISLRSKGSFPANKVAAELFNGGGHLNAAGGESYDTMLKTVRKFEKELPSYFEAPVAPSVGE